VTIPRAGLTAIFPQVFVTDFASGLSFYRDGLGFTVAYTYGDPPYYGLVERDGIGLNLRHVDEPVWDRGEEPDLLSAMIVCADIDGLFAEIERRGAPLHQPLKQQPWGIRDFIVRDPDGNLIAFAEAAKDE